MPVPRFTLRPLAAAAAPLAATTAAHAQDAAPKPDANDGLGLDSVVVTGTGERVAKMKSSVSVSGIDGDVIANSNATSAADVPRQIPGLRAEASGGESNANVGVRGIPISAGGARYLQFQEDGLPVLMFGDIAFATPDTWLRVDNGIDRLEVVRGGSASTLTTGSPGGIINFISKTGTEDGGQFRANFTRQVGDNGYVSLRHLDDHTPSFMATAVHYANGHIEGIPGLDPRRTTFYDAGWPQDNTLTSSTVRTNSNIRDGL